MCDNVLAEHGALEIVKKDAARPQTRGFDFVRIGFGMKSGPNFHGAVWPD